LADGDIAFMAHELNTPLMLMKHYTELVKCSEGEQQQKFLNALETISLELLESSQFFLENFKQLSGGKAQEHSQIYIKELIDSRFELFNPLIEEKNIRCENHIQPILLSYVPKTALTIVLNNLIGNALKFTPVNGTITIKNHSRIIQILDTAPAIVAHDRLKIFEAFQKAASDQSHSGFGLGLHISSELIDSWGGKIWLKSYPNQGNQFSFTVPSP
jgi:signal transduction histidine kinase